MIIFKLKEVQARYNVRNVALAGYLGLKSDALISEYRSGAKTPKLDRVDRIMDAIAELGNKEKLELYPLSFSDLVEYRPNTTEASKEDQKENIVF
ncbi:XRE family transcriptional regulator [Leptolyngbyaceae cyanobacterium CCMR0082]|uniref:XRE family transcriptional regulator n=1 Tax=Adonisia turfae CCMR0082 TaxID=2304604 RepID=A0A6M0S873_9CYAN|nr:XRE family transcriptional regulator [Adonisia turfae]NEZ64629.1 XRE family transcriptional regulator [Adonisia turfae CCMR0082]